MCEPIDVQGAVYTDPAQLSAIVDELRGDAILLVDTRQIERQLESIAWVESARVSTQFPHTVFIDIRERKPIATFAGSDGKFRVIDRDGRVLDVVDGVPIDYMLVTGANPDVDRGQFAGRPFASAAQLAIALPSEIRALTRSIGVDATAGDLDLAARRRRRGAARPGSGHVVEARAPAFGGPRRTRRHLRTRRLDLGDLADGVLDDHDVHRLWPRTCETCPNRR